MLLIYLVLLIKSTNAFPNIIYEEDNRASAVFNEIVSQFRDYIKIIHFDNSSYEIIPKIVLNHSSIMLNYNFIPRQMKMVKEKRPYIHMLLINERNLDQTKVNASSLRSSDVVFFLILKKHDNLVGKVCPRQYFHQANAVFIYDLNSSQLWACCYFCGKQFATTRKLSVEEGKIPKFDNLMRKYTNFWGYRFKVGYTEMIPLIFSK